MKIKLFNLSAGAVFCFTGLAKIVSVFGTAALLRRLDPVLHIEFSHLMLFSGVVELIIAVLCFCLGDFVFTTIVVAWLSVSLLIYRLSLWWVGYQRPCKCLGSLTDALHIRGAIADNIMKFILTYLIAGSFFCLFLALKKKQKKNVWIV